MTLHILWLMIKRYWWLVVGIPIVCVACCAVVLLGRPAPAAESSAEVNIIPNSQFQTVSGLVSSETALAGESAPGMKIVTKPMADKMTITITVSGADAEQAKEIALQIANNAAQKASEFFDNLDPELKVLPFFADVTDPVVTQSASQSDKRLLVVAGLAGLFVALCVLVIIYIKRRPVVDAESLEDNLALPVLECLPTADGGNRLLANVRFAANDNDVKSVCLVPLADGDAAKVVGDEILSALRTEQRAEAMEIECCSSLLQSMDAAYSAQKAEAVVLCVRMWKDRMRTVMSAKAELQLAKAPLIGVVLLKANDNKQ